MARDTGTTQQRALSELLQLHKIPWFETTSRGGGKQRPARVATHVRFATCIDTKFNAKHATDFIIVSSVSRKRNRQVNY